MWVISAFYLLSTAWTLYSFASMSGGSAELTAAQQEYLDSLTQLDWVLSISIGAVGLAAAVCLFLLRRVAVMLFAVALALNVTFTLVHVVRTNFVDAIGAAGGAGALMAWAVLVVVILYARRLARSGILS